MITHLGWHDGEPDARLLQAGFTVLLLGVMAIRVLGDRAVSLGPWQVAGVALPGAAALLVIALPHTGRSHAITRSLAVLDIAGLGMLAHGQDLGTASPLAVLPALWLGLDLGLRGGTLAVGATLAFITLPEILEHGPDALRMEQLIILPVVVGVGSVAITAGVNAARVAQARAEARDAELQAAMGANERQRRSLQAIFDAVDVGLVLTDPDGTPTLMNRSMRRNTQLAYPNGFRGEGRVVAADGETVLALDQTPRIRGSRGEEFEDVRVWIGTDPGSRRALSVSARRVEGEDGTLLGAALAYTDVTDYMYALQVKDEFVALVSHELRTPLTSIIGYVQIMLERDDLEPGLRRHLEVVARNARRLHGLVADLLDEAQYTREAGPVVESSTDLATIVRDCVVAARPQAERDGVALHLTAPASLTYAGDPHRLAQLVDNLVSNAIKYTGSGGRACVLVEHAGDSAVIRVRDSGIGITPEDQGQLFNRFFRAREATVRAIPGVGLGLSIVKAIVDSHGGVIEVESEIGSGSEFRVVLPLREVNLTS